MLSCVLVTRTAIRQPSGTTAFDRLRDRLDRESRRCPSCGYEDADGRWRADTSGDRVRYAHECPSCGAVDSLELRF